MKSEATHVAHWVTGPVYGCAKHTKLAVALGYMMGAHVNVTIAEAGHECANCSNESHRLPPTSEETTK